MAARVSARRVALPVRLDRGVREENRQRDHALIEVVHERRDLREQRLANLPAEEAPRRREDDELGERVEQVHLSRLAPLPEVILRLLDHHPDVRAKAVGLERVREEPELLRARQVVDVEDDALAERRDVELVHLLLRHVRVSRLEKVFADVRADEERDPLVEHRDCGLVGSGGRGGVGEEDGASGGTRRPREEGPSRTILTADGGVRWRRGRQVGRAGRARRGATDRS